ncbi:MAG: hypothetical protein NT036_04405 [Candidatus Omnitrophica bacterium]|nr:hypothetical protein [Candidatus Omnitrophota bacterium]
MKIMLSIVVALFIVFTSYVLCHCQPDSLVDGIKTIDGTVVSVDSQNSQIVVKSSEIMSFSVPLSAKIINADGFGIQLSDVNAGNYVTVDYSNDKSGNHVISGMEVAYNR